MLPLNNRIKLLGLLVFLCISMPLTIFLTLHFQGTQPQHQVPAQQQIPPQQQTPPLQQQQTVNKVSSFLFGANIDAQMAISPAAVKQLDVRTMRLGSGPHYAQNLQIIKDMGLTPLIILRGCGVLDPQQRLAENIRMIHTAQQTFGVNTRMYYEIGNENDLQCSSSSRWYTETWNAMVPQLKQLAPASWFIGPVNYQYNPPYIAYVVHNAVPRPDAVSWHEYTCSSTSAASECIARIANWTPHITATRNAIKANGDAVPPIMITEWNYAPDDGVVNDDKHNNPSFMTEWTTTALQTLVANNVFASYHFNVSNVTPLLNSAQGAAFRTSYQKLMNNNKVQRA